jgi:hypothetical protein
VVLAGGAERVGMPALEFADALQVKGGRLDADQACSYYRLHGGSWREARQSVDARADVVVAPLRTGPDSPLRGKGVDDV